MLEDKKGNKTWSRSRIQGHWCNDPYLARLAATWKPKRYTRKSNFGSSVFHWLKKKCAGLTRESWVEIKFEKQQKSSTEQESRKGDGWHFSWWTDGWMDGWTVPWKKRERAAPVCLSWTPDPPARHNTSTPMRRPSSPTTTHRSAQTRSVLPPVDRSHTAWATTSRLFP